MEVKVKKLRETAILPTYATDGSGAFDIYAEGTKWNSYPFSPGVSEVIHTGLAFEIPPEYVMLVFSRSGHGFKYDIRLANCVAVIDSDFRGELLIKLHKDVILTSPSESTQTFLISPGGRIAQGIILPYPRVTFEVVDELSSTERGTGGFGSTGA